MPYADPEQRRAAQKRWSEKVIAQGYGKWLYARRKLRFDDVKRFRTAIEEALIEIGGGKTPTFDDVHKAVIILRAVLEESRQAEEDLGRFQERGPDG